MTVQFRRILFIATIVVGLAAPAWTETFSFSTGNTDGRLGALSRPPNAAVETETADDFVLTDTTVIQQATIVGLVPAGTPLSAISRVEVEIYHIFPLDSANPPSGRVPTRNNSPADVEIDTATRDSLDHTLTFTATLLNATFSVPNSVVNNIFPPSPNPIGGEGPKTGEEVKITITFTPPIILPAGHYFFRPEAEVRTGNFLLLSAAHPQFTGDLQAWIRNANLKPDWLRIGTDIVGGTTFNMTFSLSGNTVPDAGVPRQSNCRGKSMSALSRQFGGIHTAAESLGFASEAELQQGFVLFCQP